MKKVFEYLDYREFLKEYHQKRQEANPGFSVRAFLQKAGIKSPSFFKQVVEGERNLTPAAAEKFLNAMKLPDAESDYFRTLVQFNQAVTPKQKQESYLELLKQGKAAKITILGEQQYSYYKEWYLPALREIATMKDFQGDFKAMGATLSPPIGTREAKNGIKILLQLDLLVENADGSYSQKDKVLHTGDEVQSMVIREFNRKMTLLAEESLDRYSINERNVRGISMSVSEETYKIIEQEINAFHNRILRLMENEADTSAKKRVYQCNTMLFPLSAEISSEISSESSNKSHTQDSTEEK